MRGMPKNCGHLYSTTLTILIVFLSMVISEISDISTRNTSTTAHPDRQRDTLSTNLVALTLTWITFGNIAKAGSSSALARVKGANHHNSYFWPLNDTAPLKLSLQINLQIVLIIPSAFIPRIFLKICSGGRLEIILSILLLKNLK